MSYIKFKVLFTVGVCICSVSAWSQVTKAEGASRSLNTAVSTLSSKAYLPTLWVNQHECDGEAPIMKKVCTLGDSQCPNAPGDYAATSKGLNQAIVDAENRRASAGQGTTLVITAGSNIKIVNPPQTIVARNFGYIGTQCIIFQSSNPLPAGVRVGSVAIRSIQRDQAQATVTVSTTSSHGLRTGEIVELKNVSGWTTNFNGTFPVTVQDALTFTYSQSGPSEPGTVTPMLTVMTGPNTLGQQVSTHMYRLESTTVNTPAIITDPGAHHYVWYDGEITTTNVPYGQAQPLVIFGPNPPAKTFANNASHIGFDRMYVHGCAGVVPTTIPIWPEPVDCGGIEAGLKSGVRMNCAYCWVMNSFFDQMQLRGTDTHAVGTYDGQGPFKIVNNHLRGASSTLHFGGTSPSIPGLVPSDMEIRLNTIDLDPNWHSLSNYCAVPRTPRWALSNRLDLKNAQRIVFEGNELYQSWCDGGTGFLVSFLPMSCGTATCVEASQTAVRDIYFANNLGAHSYGIFQTSGRSGYGESQATQRVDVLNNLFWDIGVPGYGSGAVQQFGIGSGGQTYSCSATRASGIATLNLCVCSTFQCPSTGISPGDWVFTSCADATFNSSRNPAVTSDPTTLGPLTYNSTGPDVSSPVSCLLSNAQGWPKDVSYRHNTTIANTATAGVKFVGNANGPNSYFPRNFTMVDSISSVGTGTNTGVGWFCNGIGYGSQSSKAGRCWDTSTLDFHHFVAEGRSSKGYSEYFNGTEVYPPTTLAFSPRNSCGGILDASCVGYAGDFTSPNPTDYHDFVLCQGAGSPSACSGRSYFAGQASDATDIGADIYQIDRARVKLQFNENSFPQ